MQCRLSLKIVGRYNERYNTKVYTQTTLSPKAFSQGLCFGAFMLFIYVIMDKKSVLLYLDSLNVLDSLTDEQAWKLIKKIRAYSAWLEYDPKEQLIDVVFVQFKNYIDVNTEKYNGICEKNKDNVRKRWDKENTTVYDRIPLDTKHTDKDTDTDTDTDKESKKKKNPPSAIKSFSPPSAEEVAEYCKSRNSPIDAKYFYDLYTAQGRVDTNWKPVLSWKWKVITREKNNKWWSAPIPDKEPTNDKEKWELYVRIGRKKYTELFWLDKAAEANKIKNIYWLDSQEWS